jgi:hypothetical protein
VTQDEGERVSENRVDRGGCGGQLCNAECDDTAELGEGDRENFAVIECRNETGGVEGRVDAREGLVIKGSLGNGQGAAVGKNWDWQDFKRKCRGARARVGTRIE